MRKIINLICAIILIMLSLLVIHNIPHTVSGGNPPPPDDGIDGLQYIDGDWDVNGVESYTDEIIVLTGNLTILNGGSLTFNNVNLMMNNTSENGIYNIEVQTGGSFTILGGSNITDSPLDIDDGSASDYRYMFWVRVDSAFSMIDSELHEVGWDNMNPGLVIDTNATTFINSTITRCKLGIMFNWTSNHYVSDCRIMQIGSGFDFDGIMCYNSYNNIFRNSYFEDIVSVGISLYYSANNTIENCTFVNAKVGIGLGYADNNSISNVNIQYSQPDGGIKLYEANNNTFINVTIMNTPRMLFLENPCYNNTFENFTMINSLYGYYSRDYSENNLLINSTIINSTISSIYLYTDAHLTVLNTSFNESKVSVQDVDSSLIVQWYLHAKVINSTGYPIQDADVDIYNVTDSLVAQGQTGLDGFLRWIEVTERIQYQGGNETYTPHNISATKNAKMGYAEPEPYINSSQVVNIILDVSAPSAPQNLQAFAGDGYVNLTWNAPVSEGSSPITNYRIYRGTSPGGESFLIEIGDGDFYNDTTVVNGIDYYYKVSAKNDDGEGPLSNEATGTPSGGTTIPSEPLDIAVDAGNSYVNVTWNPPASDGGSPITHYEIYRGDAPGVDVFLVEIGNLSYYNDTTVTNGNTYYYKVSAKNAIGEGAQSNEVDATPSSVPTAPQNLISAAGNGYVNISWDSPSDDGGFSITNYRIYRGTTLGGEAFLTEIGNLLFFNDTAVINGAPYYYRVSAKNSRGEGAQSNEVVGTPGTGETVPSEPQNLEATAGDSYVNLTWDAPASDGGSSIIYYEIYRGTTQGAEGFLIEIPNVLLYNDTTVINSVTYYYKVSAKNGVGEGLQSSGVNATPEVQVIPPNQPPTVTITSHSAGANVSGTVTISGNAFDSDGIVQTVEIRIDGGSWNPVIGIESWSYNWHTNDVDNGEHTIYIRSYDGINYSSITSITITVNNPSDDGFDITWLLLIIVLIIVVIVILLLVKKKNRGGVKPEKLPDEEEIK
jgi:parallel beta-helix repeat protein